MTHYWRIDGTQSRYVHHTAAESRRGTDAAGVGAGEDVLGPFGSARLAQKVANALNNAYLAGQQDKAGEGSMTEAAAFRFVANLMRTAAVAEWEHPLRIAARWCDVQSEAAARE